MWAKADDSKLRWACGNKKKHQYIDKNLLHEYTERELTNERTKRVRKARAIAIGPHSKPHRFFLCVIWSILLPFYSFLLFSPVCMLKLLLLWMKDSLAQPLAVRRFGLVSFSSPNYLFFFFLWMSTKRDEGESFFFAVPNCFRCFFYICTVKSSNGSYYILSICLLQWLVTIRALTLRAKSKRMKNFSNRQQQLTSLDIRHTPNINNGTINDGWWIGISVKQTPHVS